MRFALIHNARSRRNLRDGPAFVAQARAYLGERFILSDSREATTLYVRRLCAEGVRLIAIDGGDGTVGTVLTAIARAYPEDSLPDIAVLPSGNTNLIAADIGFGWRGMEALQRLGNGAITGSSLRRPIRLSWPDPGPDPGSDPDAGPDRLPVLGLFGGCAGYARAVAIAHSPAVLNYASHDLAVGITLVSTAVSLILRRTRERWLAGDPLRIETRNGVLDGRSFIFLITGLSRLSRGMWPFWDGGSGPLGDGGGDEGGHEGALRYLDVAARPRSLCRATLALLRGRAPAWLRGHPDYVSGRTDGMTLVTPGDFVLDGESFPPSPSGRLRLERGPEFRFLHG